MQIEGYVIDARRGSALLAVLWLTAALSAIAFSVANTVRAETERTSTAVDSVRAYYLATGAINRAILRIEWGPGYRNPDGTSMFGAKGQAPLTMMQFDFPSGSAVVIRNCGWACGDGGISIRSAFRNNWNIPSVGLNWLGFRVVMAPIAM